MKKNIQDIEPKFIGIGLTFGVVFGAAMNNVGLGISLGLAVGTGIGFFKSKTSWLKLNYYKRAGSSVGRAVAF